MAYYNKIPIYPIFYLLQGLRDRKGDYRLCVSSVRTDEGLQTLQETLDSVDAMPHHKEDEIDKQDIPSGRSQSAITSDFDIVPACADM